jgi:hypothetical protein
MQIDDLPFLLSRESRRHYLLRYQSHQKSISGKHCIFLETKLYF